MELCVVKALGMGIKKNIDKIIIVSAFVLIIITQSFLFHPRQEILKERLLLEIEVSNGDYSTIWALNRGSDKPLIKYRNIPIMEYSAWASGVSVDGSDEVLLWLHTYNVKEVGNKIYASFLSRDSAYLIEQKITVTKEATIVAFWVTPLTHSIDITFRIGHYKWFWDDVEFSNNQIICISNGDITYINMSYTPQNIVVHWTPSFVVNYFDVYYSLSNVTTRTPIASETVYHIED